MSDKYEACWHRGEYPNGCGGDFYFGNSDQVAEFEAITHVSGSKEWLVRMSEGEIAAFEDNHGCSLDDAEREDVWDLDTAISQALENLSEEDRSALNDYYLTRDFKSDDHQKVVEWSNKLPYSDARWEEVTLYLSSKGALYLVKEGGGLSPNCGYRRDGRTTHNGRAVTEIDRDDVRDWCREHGISPRRKAIASLLVREAA